MSDIPTFSNPADKLKLDGMVRECVVALEKIKDLKSFMKDVAERAKEELAFPSADFNALVAERFGDKQSKVLEKAERLVQLNEELLDVSRKHKVSNPTNIQTQTTVSEEEE
jgi:hypothetical protein